MLDIIIILALVFLSLLMIIIGYWNITKNDVCVPKVEYRFISRTFAEELKNPPKVEEIYPDLFGGDKFNYVVKV